MEETPLQGVRGWVVLLCKRDKARKEYAGGGAKVVKSVTQASLRQKVLCSWPAPGKFRRLVWFDSCVISSLSLSSSCLGLPLVLVGRIFPLVMADGCPSIS